MIQEPLEDNPWGVVMTRTLGMLVSANDVDPAAVLELDRRIEENRTALRRMIKIMPARAVAANLSQAIDAAMRDHDRAHQEAAAGITCRGKGCSHCCSIAVRCTEPEADLLAAAARTRRFSIDRSRLQAQAAAGDRFDELPFEQRRCVFLDDAGACAVYDVRPYACRSYRVTSDPSQCDTVAHKGGRVAVYAVAGAEILASAALRQFRNGPMPELLLEKLK